jgi:hypothetical protein
MAKFGALAFAFAIALLPGAPAAAAGNLADTMRSVGLLGRFAVRCDAPASFANNISTFKLIPPNGAQQTVDFGKRIPHVFAIVSASPVRSVPDEISIGLNFVTERQTVLIRVRRDSIRTLSNISSNGVVHVRDGIVLPTGKPTPTLSRCAGPAN